MNALQEHICHFIETVTGASVHLSLGLTDGRVPRFIRNSYDLLQLEFGDTRWLGLKVIRTDEVRPAQVEKHMTLLSQLPYDGIVLLAEQLPYYIRRRLVERSIAFVVPNVQLFWPALGVSMQRQVKRRPLPEVQVFRPATQVVALYLLLELRADPVNLTQLADELGYSNMTITRAFNELQARGAVTVQRSAKLRKLLPPSDRRNTWEQLMPYLRNPVRETVYVRMSDIKNAKHVIAGGSALSARSLLDVPEVPVFAISGAVWKALLQHDVERIPIPDNGMCELQIWRYDPMLLARSNAVDPFSLYLSFLSVEEERVRTTLDRMMEEFTW